MSIKEQIITIAICGGATLLTRFLPFILFHSKKGTPKVVTYLGKVLPLSVFSLLIVYCLKDISFIASPYGIPEILGVAITIVLHLIKRNMLLSIACGTITYMLLIQFVF